MNDLCNETDLQALVDNMQTGKGNDLARIDELLTSYPNDPRIHFLRGSVLAGTGKLIEAHASLSKAVEIAPDFSIARFQLGFFQLTSGESNNALKTWALLDQLPEDHYLKLFVVGLRHLIRDEFVDCIANLQGGIKLNDENLPLNDDMRLIIEQCTPLVEEQAQDDEEQSMSATSLLLKQHSGNDQKH